MSPIPSTLPRHVLCRTTMLYQVVWLNFCPCGRTLIIQNHSWLTDKQFVTFSANISFISIFYFQKSFQELKNLFHAFLNSKLCMEIQNIHKFEKKNPIFFLTKLSTCSGPSVGLELPIARPVTVEFCARTCPNREAVGQDDGRARRIRTRVHLVIFPSSIGRDPFITFASIFSFSAAHFAAICRARPAHLKILFNCSVA